MVKSVFNKSPDQVNIFDLLIICWKDRILIITVLLVSIVVGLIVSFFSHKKEMQQILFEIRYPVNAIFKFNDFKKDKLEKEKVEIEKEKLEFISIFESNLNSLNNLDSFVEQSKDLDSFKNFLSKNKISSKEYFRTFRISSFADKYGKKVAYANLLSKYVFTYPAELIEGDKFLTNYIEYTKKKTLEEYSLSIKFAAQQECENIEKLFDSIKSAEFFKFEKINDEFATTFVNYSNCKTLSKNFDKFIFQINNYNFLNENVSVGTIVPSVPRYFYLLLSLLFGFFIAIVIIFFKKNFKDR